MHIKITTLMKKILFFAFCMMLSVGAFAQQPLFQKHNNARNNAFDPNFRLAESLAAKGDYNYRMSGYSTDDNYIVCRFYYDDQHRLEAVYEYVPGEYELYDSVRYNESDQLVRLDGYQWLGGQWRHVYYIEYTYNDAGLIASRTNYNNMDGEFQEGGVYEYTYNADGQIMLTRLTMMGDLYQQVNYLYDNGLLLSETWSYAGFGSGALEPSDRLNYTYADGRLTSELHSIYDNGMWSYYGRCDYSYDAAGNCLEYHRYDRNDSEVERSVYRFDDRTVEETLMPWNPELVRPELYNNVNIYTREEYWTLDVDMVLQYVGDYVYNYVGINDAGIADLCQAPLAVSPNPALDQIVVAGLDGEACPMEVVDMSGRVVMRGLVSASQPVDVSALQNGCYVVRVADGATLHTAKLVVR